MTETFIESNNAVELYARLSFETKGHGETFKESWREVLETNGVVLTQDVNEDDILPKKIIGAIEDAVLADKVFRDFNTNHFAPPTGLPLEPARIPKHFRRK